ncbi:uncharacterized protein N7479_006120 [Penicillium vulpinum]|uniref:uncharacterized protein n=1 Tax=Penicillium vulpinum TaxID=29845 RepID=UPI002547B846|nr:uncharacterized protein N7479_006120 [Penicillium vulpinum]KAJ5958970.1 hypothetical protein N7479_006120 [Penicillium vulpinum]
MQAGSHEEFRMSYGVRSTKVFSTRVDPNQLQNSWAPPTTSPLSFPDWQSSNLLLSIILIFFRFISSSFLFLVPRFWSI